MIFFVVVVVLADITSFSSSLKILAVFIPFAASSSSFPFLLRFVLCLLACNLFDLCNLFLLEEKRGEKGGIETDLHQEENGSHHVQVLKGWAT